MGGNRGRPLPPLPGPPGPFVRAPPLSRRWDSASPPVKWGSVFLGWPWGWDMPAATPWAYTSSLMVSPLPPTVPHPLWPGHGWAWAVHSCIEGPAVRFRPAVFGPLVGREPAEPSPHLPRRQAEPPAEEGSEAHRAGGLDIGVTQVTGEARTKAPVTWLHLASRPGLHITLCLWAGSRHCPSLWAGTNGGTVYAFALRVPPAERRMDEPVRAEQGEC